MKTVSSIIPALLLSLVLAAGSAAYAADDVFATSAASTNAMAGIDDSTPAGTVPATLPAPATASVTPPAETSSGHLVGILFGVAFCLGTAWWFIHLYRDDAENASLTHTQNDVA